MANTIHFITKKPVFIEKATASFMTRAAAAVSMFHDTSSQKEFLYHMRSILLCAGSGGVWFGCSQFVNGIAHGREFFFVFRHNISFYQDRILM